MKDSIPRLVIRCDSYEACGYGHLARCLEVAIHLNKYKNFNIAFVGHFDLFSKYSLNAHNLNFMDSPPQGIYNWEFLDLFELGSIDMILVDSYNIDQHFINQGVKIHNKVIYFDDFCNLDFVNTFAVFNSRIGAEILYRSHYSKKIFGS
jgi:spore coat polysaccharide biosynthesis predicted glycosyltransferase SpsG